MTYDITYFAQGKQVHRESLEFLSLADAKRHASETVCGLRSRYDVRQVSLYDGETIHEMSI